LGRRRSNHRELKIVTRKGLEIPSETVSARASAPINPSKAAGIVPSLAHDGSAKA
jgi:hypothetical protein